MILLVGIEFCADFARNLQEMLPSHSGLALKELRGF